MCHVVVPHLVPHLSPLLPSGTPQWEEGNAKVQVTLTELFADGSVGAMGHRY